MDRRFDTILREIDLMVSSTAETARLRSETLEMRAESIQLQIDQRFAASEAKVTTALTAADLATTKAETAAEKRFDSVNEFRKTLADQTNSFVTSDKYDGLAEQVSRLQSRMDTSGGSTHGAADAVKAAQAANSQRILVLGLVISIVVIIVNVALFAVTH